MQGIFKALLLQVFAALAGSLLGGLFFGMRGFVSAALGGAACVIPSCLFAFRLYVVAKRPGASYAAAFFAGELIKIALSIGLLAAVTQIYPEVHWGAVMIGLIVTLQANFLAFLVKT